MASRVVELKAQAAKRTEKTVTSLVADLDEIIELATMRNPAAMVAAIAQQAAFSDWNRRGSWRSCISSHVYRPRCSN